MRTYRTHILAGLVGAIAGGVLLALATEAIPKMMSAMMSGMMGHMMSRMQAGGCNPEEM